MFQTKAHSQRICPSKWKRLWELWFAPPKADRPARIGQGLRGRGAVLKDELSEHSGPWRNLAQKGGAWDICLPPSSACHQFTGQTRSYPSGRYRSRLPFSGWQMIRAIIDTRVRTCCWINLLKLLKLA